MGAVRGKGIESWGIVGFWVGGAGGDGWYTRAAIVLDEGDVLVTGRELFVEIAELAVLAFAPLCQQ